MATNSHAKAMAGDLETTRSKLIERADRDSAVAESLRRFNEIVGLVPAPKLVNSAQVRFSTGANQ